MLTATLAESIEDQQIGSQILEQSVEALNEPFVEEYCGQKHVRDNGDKRYQPGCTDDRTISTTLGERGLDLHYVEDDEEGSCPNRART